MPQPIKHGLVSTEAKYDTKTNPQPVLFQNIRRTEADSGQVVNANEILNTYNHTAPFNFYQCPCICNNYIRIPVNIEYFIHNKIYTMV